MKKLKDLLFEVSGTTKPDIIGPGRDPWDYAYDKQTQTWWARRKTQDTYVDLSKALTPDKYAKAKAILDNLYEKQFSKLPYGDKPKTDTNDNELLSKAQKIILDVISELEDMIQNHPEKHFKSFKSVVNDKEDEAAAYFAKYFNKHLAPRLTKAMSISKQNKIIQSNVESIGQMGNSFAGKVVNGSILTMGTYFNISITDPITKKSEVRKIYWDYL